MVEAGAAAVAPAVGSLFGGKYTGALKLTFDADAAVDDLAAVEDAPEAAAVVVAVPLVVFLAAGIVGSLGVSLSSSWPTTVSGAVVWASRPGSSSAR